MGREIAQVMGFDGIDWLDRPERAEQERPDVVIKALGLHEGDVAADLGAGQATLLSAWPAWWQDRQGAGRDLQDEMLATLQQRAAAMALQRRRDKGERN